MSQTDLSQSNPELAELFSAGAHFGYSRRRFHPSTEEFIFNFKNRRAIIDLDKTLQSLKRAEEFITAIAAAAGQILWVGNKPAARPAILAAAEITNMPYVAWRWIGGTLTNFSEISKRVERLKTIKDDEAAGNLAKYTKRERAEILRDKDVLEQYFGGIAEMPRLPKLLVIVDPKEEDIAVKEAVKKNIPIIALANVDCDLRSIDYPIVANDNQTASIKLVIDRLAKAALAGLNQSRIESTKTDDEVSELENSDIKRQQQARVQAGLAG